MALHRRTLLSAASTLALAPLATPAIARDAPGVTSSEIKVGNTVPYSGNASAYGVNGRAASAFFRMLNDQGGINGRKVNYISLDDGYSPPKTVELVRQLVERDRVLLCHGTLGTACNTAIHRYMNQRKVPQLFVATGASKWGKPREFPWTMGWQPDYHTEGVIYAKHALASISDPKIGILRQNDDMGVDYVEGFREGVGSVAEQKIVAEATYEVTDPTVDSQILQLKNSGANVFFNVTTPKFGAQAIKKAAEIGWRPTQYIVNVAASVGAVMRPAGFENAQGIMTAIYIKDVTDPTWESSEDFKAWRKFMTDWNTGGNPMESANATGYASAFTLAHVLRQCGNDLSRENVMHQAANMKDLEVPMLLPGIRLNTSPTDYYPIQSVQLARFEGEHWTRFGDVLSAGAA
jgi:branched-chain amino acid transport system substrate-binding protein